MGGCNTCGGGINYSKKHQHNEYKKCHCHEVESDCGCKVELGTECVRWEDKNIPYLDVKTNERLTSVIHKLSNRLHEMEYALKFIPKLDTFQINGDVVKTSSLFDVRTLKVFVDGVLMKDSLYEVVDNETIRFTTPMTNNKTIKIDYYKLEGYEL